VKRSILAFRHVFYRDTPPNHTDFIKGGGGIGGYNATLVSNRNWIWVFPTLSSEGVETKLR